MTNPVAEKYDDVLLPFLALMRKELHANSRKGDRPGWLALDPNTLLLEVYWHTAKLSAAVKNNDGPAILEHSADVANMAMMVLDRCGGLAWADDAPPTARLVEAGKVRRPPADRAEFERRIIAAIRRLVDGHAPMRVPADPTDPDLVLADCLALLRADGEKDAQPAEQWRPMDTAPTDDKMVRLLVDYSGEDACHPLEDARIAETIGINTDRNTGLTEGWKFAGWSWEHDCFTQGQGKPIGWLPLPPTLGARAGLPFDRAAVFTIWQGMQFQGGILTYQQAVQFAQQVLAAHGHGAQVAPKVQRWPVSQDPLTQLQVAAVIAKRDEDAAGVTATDHRTISGQTPMKK